MENLTVLANLSPVDYEGDDIVETCFRICKAVMHAYMLETNYSGRLDNIRIDLCQKSQYVIDRDSSEERLLSEINKLKFYAGENIFDDWKRYCKLAQAWYLTRAFVKEYEPELIYYVKDRYERVLGSEICRVVDIDNCGLGRLRDTIKKRALKRSDNIYANWEQFCKYAEVYYAYLIKYAKERNTKDIVLNVSAYRDLISNDTVSFIATNWLPNQATGESYGTVSKIVPCSQIMSEVVDFINKRSEKVTEYDIAKIPLKYLASALSLQRESTRIM